MRLEASLSQSKKDSQNVSPEKQSKSQINKNQDRVEEEEEEQMDEEPTKQQTVSLNKPTKTKTGRLKKLGSKIILNGQFLISSDDEDEKKNNSKNKDTRSGESDEERKEGENEDDDKDFMESPVSKSKRLCQPLLTQQRQLTMVLNKKIDKTQKSNQATSSPKVHVPKTSINDYFINKSNKANRSLNLNDSTKEVQKLSKSNIEIERLYSEKKENCKKDKSSSKNKEKTDEKENEISIIENDSNKPTTSKKINSNVTTEADNNDMSLESINQDDDNEPKNNNTTINTTSNVGVIKKRIRKKVKGLWNVNRWSETETIYLIAGVNIYGKGNWAKILSEFSTKFNDRSSVNLKDRYRNLENSGQLEGLTRQANMLLNTLRAAKSPLKLRQT